MIIKTKLPEITLKFKRGEIFNRKITESAHSFEVFKEIFNKDTLEIFESFYILFLNYSNNTIGWIMHSAGGAAHTTIDIKLIMIAALQCGAKKLVCCHNHPSGNVEPSKSDIAVVEKIKKAADLLDIVLLDNLIITSNSYYSFIDKALL